MRGDLTPVVFIIVAVVLAGAILVVGMGGIEQIRKQFGLFGGVSQQMIQQMNPQTVKDVCQSWINTGSRMYDPDTITGLGLVDAFRPYGNFWDECGGPINVLVTACKSNPEECPNGVLDYDARAYSREFGSVRGSDVISCCTTACGSAISIYQECEMQEGPNQAQIINCFNQRMEEERIGC